MFSVLYIVTVEKRIIIKVFARFFKRWFSFENYIVNLGMNICLSTAEELKD